MRIGEYAALVGVSTRTVRHYHQLGLLPEPVRLSNGYRDYRLGDAVALTRVRHLAELGLSLEEIRDVLADDRGRELREVLLELDADLARQQETIAAKRSRLAALLAAEDLRPDSAVSPEMADVLRALPADGSESAAFDREMLTLAGALSGPAERARLVEMLRPLTEPDAVARARVLYERLDGLAGAAPGDPRVAALADELVAHLPDETAAAMRQYLRQGGIAGPSEDEEQPLGRPGRDGAAERDHPDAAGGGEPWLRELSGHLSPAQSEVVRLFVAKLAARAAGGGTEETCC
jgi:DNA-binding transcriptional MerR regulator